MRKVFISLGLLLVVAAPALAQISLTAIAPTGSTNNTRALGMTPDGQHVVGLQYTGTASAGKYNFGEQAVIWDVVNGTRVITSNSGPTIVAGTGVGYRLNSGGQQELVISGRVGLVTTNAQNSAILHAPVGAAAGDATSNTTTYNVGNLYNAIAVNSDNSTFYSMGQKWTTGTENRNAFWKQNLTGDNPSTATEVSFSNGTARATAYGISRTGRMVGRAVLLDDLGASASRKIYMDDDGVLHKIKGLALDVFGINNTDVGEAMAISGNGRYIYGRSTPSGGFLSPDAYDTATGSINMLPKAFDPALQTTGAVFGATNDGSMAGGMNFTVATDERAVLWQNLTDPNPANWTVTDMTAFFQARGKLGNFTRLSRVYSISDDGLWIAGEGVVSDGGVNYTRGWVAYLPEPATLSLLALGGLLIRRRRS